MVIELDMFDTVKTNIWKNLLRKSLLFIDRHITLYLYMYQYNCTLILSEPRPVQLFDPGRAAWSSILVETEGPFLVVARKQGIKIATILTHN